MAVFSLRSLLIAVTLVAAAMGIWMSSHSWLASAVYSLASLLPAVAAIAAVAAQAERRCRWLGCLILSLWAIFVLGDQAATTLVTSKVNESLYLNVFVKLRPPPPMPPSGMLGGMGGMSGGMGTFGGMPQGMGGSAGNSPPLVTSYPSLEEFAQIGHAYFAFLAGAAGYVLAGFLYRRFRKSEAAP